MNQKSWYKNRYIPHSDLTYNRYNESLYNGYFVRECEDISAGSWRI